MNLVDFPEGLIGRVNRETEMSECKRPKQLVVTVNRKKWGNFNRNLAMKRPIRLTVHREKSKILNVNLG